MTPDGVRRRVEAAQVETFLLQAQDWQRLSMSEGSKGPRLFDWACVPLLHRWEDDGQHWMLIRRNLADPNEKAYYFVFAPQGTTLSEMVAAIGARWHIEEDFENAKDSGLDHYEVDFELARYAGLLKNEWARRGRTISSTDVLIGATALAHKLILMTDNRKDFPMTALAFYPLP